MLLKTISKILIYILRNVDFRESLKTIVNEAVEERFTKEKIDMDKKFNSIDEQLKKQKEGSSKVEEMLATLISTTNKLLEQKQVESKSPPSDDRKPRSSRKDSRRSTESRSPSTSRSNSNNHASENVRRNSKRDRTPSPSRNNKRAKKSKEPKITHKERAIANIKEQQSFRNDFTSAVTKLPKWFVEESNLNPMAYIAVRFGYVHEECRSYARARDERGQTYEAWRNLFHGEAYHRVKEYDEIAGKAYYSAIRANKKPILKKIVPYWFTQKKNRAMPQIHPNIDQKNLGVWHTDIEFLNNFFLDCGGKF